MVTIESVISPLPAIKFEALIEDGSHNWLTSFQTNTCPAVGAVTAIERFINFPAFQMAADDFADTMKFFPVLAICTVLSPAIEILPTSPLMAVCPFENPPKLIQVPACRA